MPDQSSTVFGSPLLTIITAITVLIRAGSAFNENRVMVCIRPLNTLIDFVTGMGEHAFAFASPQEVIA